MSDSIKNKIVISVYKNGIFIGYIQKYRLQRNGCYRFEKTKDVRNAIKYKTDSFGLIKYIISNLASNLDTFYYNDSFEFKLKILNEQEIRKAKLLILNRTIRKGLFKNKT
jgi:hypothetical protein